MDNELKCLLVDDEPLALELLENHIKNIPRLKVVGKCDNAIQALNFLQQGSVELLFLDIEMPTLTGMAFLRSLTKPPKVIFTTAYKEFAIDAFDLNAVDYLLKPISLERLIKAVYKILSEPLKTVEESKIVDSEGFIYLRADRKMVKVRYSDILYIESLKDYVKVVFSGKKPILTKQSISSLEQVLPKHQFARIHRSFIISIPKINAFTTSEVEMQDSRIPVGRSYIQKIEDIKNYKTD